MTTHNNVHVIHIDLINFNAKERNKMETWGTF